MSSNEHIFTNFFLIEFFLIVYVCTFVHCICTPGISFWMGKEELFWKTQTVWMFSFPVFFYVPFYLFFTFRYFFSVQKLLLFFLQFNHISFIIYHITCKLTQSYQPTDEQFYWRNKIVVHV